MISVDGCQGDNSMAHKGVHRREYAAPRHGHEKACETMCTIGHVYARGCKMAGHAT